MQVETFSTYTIEACCAKLPSTRKGYAGGAPLLCSDPSAAPQAGEGLGRAKRGGRSRVDKTSSNSLKPLTPTPLPPAGEGLNNATSSASFAAQRLLLLRGLVDFNALVFRDHLRAQQQYRSGHFQAEQHDDGGGERAVHHAHLRQRAEIPAQRMAD